MKVWICPWIDLAHTGFYTFGGKLAALAAIGASATVNRDEIKKKKK
jgi:acyl-CoA thioesterase